MLEVKKISMLTKSEHWQREYGPYFKNLDFICVWIIAGIISKGWYKEEKSLGNSDKPS